jgi:opacity protein-like surface antigen
MKLLQAATMLALIASPALAAQNTTTPSNNAPSAQNSGAGISGQPGGKDGPASTMQGGASNSNQTNPTTRLQDTSKIPGKAGGKSGPAVMPPTSHSPQKP